jgi:hypothetical protein
MVLRIGPPPEVAGSPRRGCRRFKSRVASRVPSQLDAKRPCFCCDSNQDGAQDEAATRDGRVTQAWLQKVSKQSDKQATSQPDK